jgi:tubulin monoglycylase TTLL15
VDQLKLDDEGSFVQEFVDNPLLIDGYKFDIGVYTFITSIDPLRIYVFEGDVLLRFCPDKYQPFDAANRDKYVVHDDYRPTWKVQTLAKIYSDMGYSFR